MALLTIFKNPVELRGERHFVREFMRVARVENARIVAHKNKLLVWRGCVQTESGALTIMGFTRSFTHTPTFWYPTHDCEPIPAVAAGPETVDVATYLDAKLSNWEHQRGLSLVGL